MMNVNDYCVERAHGPVVCFAFDAASRHTSRWVRGHVKAANRYLAQTVYAICYVESLLRKDVRSDPFGLERRRDADVASCCPSIQGPDRQKQEGSMALSLPALAQLFVQLAGVKDWSLPAEHLEVAREAANVTRRRAYILENRGLGPFSVLLEKLLLNPTAADIRRIMEHDDSCFWPPWLRCERRLRALDTDRCVPQPDGTEMMACSRVSTLRLLMYDDAAD